MSIIDKKTEELEQLEHLQNVSEQFVKTLNGINTKFDTILDGTKLVMNVSQRWNDVFKLMREEDRDLLMIETLEEEEASVNKK
jgi:hypothetical protein|eukprot:g13485.t1